MMSLLSSPKALDRCRSLQRVSGGLWPKGKGRTVVVVPVGDLVTGKNTSPCRAIWAHPSLRQIANFFLGMVLCAICGKGHNISDFPVRWVTSPRQPAILYIEVFIEGDQTANMVVDMGASTTLVNSKFAPQSVCTGREVYIIGPGKPTQHIPLQKCIWRLNSWNLKSETMG